MKPGKLTLTLLLACLLIAKTPNGHFARADRVQSDAGDPESGEAGRTIAFVIDCVTGLAGAFRSFCEEELSYEKNGFPDTFYEPCPEQGTVSAVHTQDGSGRTSSSPVCIYTPYGYEAHPERTYNVVFLIHGSGGDRNNWLNDVYEMPVTREGNRKAELSGSRLLDWLIYTGRIEPVIAVSVDMCRSDGVRYRYADYADLANRIERYDLPYTVRTYRTYAESDAASDIAAAKDHFMIAGLSQGAICLSAVALEPDRYLGKCFGNILIMSNYTSGETVSERFGDSDSRLFFVNGGKADCCRSGSSCEIMRRYRQFENLRDAAYFEFDSGHRWYTWFRGLASVLQIAMKETPR
jgi:enterochelin esterase-like enzyme